LGAMVALMQQSVIKVYFGQLDGGGGGSAIP
jgi:hypothetical protein